MPPRKRPQSSSSSSLSDTKRQRDLRSFFSTTQKPQQHEQKPTEKSIGTNKSSSSATSDIAPLSPRKEADEILRKFDLQTEFGPCVGLSRLERWQRAQRLGKNPPLTVREILLDPRYIDQMDLQQHLWYQESFCNFNR